MVLSVVVVDAFVDAFSDALIVGQHRDCANALASSSETPVLPSLQSVKFVSEGPARQKPGLAKMSRGVAPSFAEQSAPTGHITHSPVPALVK
jgi:hypothetical protein